MQPIQISWPLVIIYLVVVLSIGVWAARTKVSTIEDMAGDKRRGVLGEIVIQLGPILSNNVKSVSKSFTHQ